MSFVELWRETFGSSRVVCRPVETLLSSQGSQISFGIVRGTLGLLSRCCRDE